METLGGKKMRKSKVILIGTLSLAVATLLLPVDLTKAVSDSEFAANESYYASICNGYVPADSPNRKTCEEYQRYLINKKNNANASISQLQKEINALGNDIDAIVAMSKNLSAQIEEANKSIGVIESTISNIQVGIEEAEVKIAKKEDDIEARKNVIKERMVQLQVKANTNQYIDYIMGATDLVDLIQRAASLENFTNYDNELIGALKVEMEQLEAEKVEKERLKEQNELQKENLVVTRQQAQDLYTENERLADLWQKQQASLIAQKNEAIRQANLASGQIDQVWFTDYGNIESANGFVRPINAGYTSAGTWAYPGGSLHLGLDKAVSIGTPVYAPANLLVLSARTGTSSSGGGYIGNMVGFPYGGGNTLHVLMSVNGQTYAMSFFHLSPNIVSSGQTIGQGQVMAYSGNTGNSSGPHAHIEVFKLNMSLENAINYWNNNQDWAWGCGWSTGGTCSSAGCRIRPESLGW